MQQLFLDEIEAAGDSMKYSADRIKQAVMLHNVFDCIDLTDVGSYSIYESSISVRTQLTLHLKAEAQGSRLPHAFAQRFGMEFTKEKNYDGKSLNYSGETVIDDHRYLVEIKGAVPDTCTLEWIEEVIPEAEVVRVRRKAVINCPGSEQVLETIE